MTIRPILVPLLFGIGGFAILIGLGTWQVQRLGEKTRILAAIEARIGAEPAALPASPDPEADRYRPVRVTGRFTGEDLTVIASQRGAGPGVHVIAAFETAEGRRILVDRGFLPQVAVDEPRPALADTIIGNLHWPRETDGFTPPPDSGRNLWFARDVPAMAEALRTEAVLVVAASSTLSTGPRPVPVGTDGIPNNHLEYAITWYLLAAAWAGMTAFLLWRIRRERDEGAV